MGADTNAYCIEINMFASATINNSVLNTESTKNYAINCYAAGVVNINNTTVTTARGCVAVNTGTVNINGGTYTLLKVEMLILFI